MLRSLKQVCFILLLSFFEWILNWSLLDFNTSSSLRKQVLKAKLNAQHNIAQPISNAQLTRILTPELKPKTAHNIINSTKKDLNYDPAIYTSNYNDLITENASFIDSPIHLLMNHHKNQRMIKQKNYEVELEKQLKLKRKQLVKIDTSFNNFMEQKARFDADVAKQKPNASFI